MLLVLLSFLVILLAVAGLAAGVLLGRKPLQGSCGGLASFNAGGECELCGGSQEKCEEISHAEKP